MKRFRVLVAGMVLAVCAGMAEAQSVYGPGGLFLNPTAYAPARRQLIWSAMYRQQDMSSDPAHGFHEHDVGVFGVDYGLSKRVELGFSLTSIHGDIDASPTYGPFGKYVLVGETPSRPQVAAGYVWQPTSHWRTEFAFAVASKRLDSTAGARPIHGHLGLMHATFLNHFPTSDFALYGGVDWALSPSMTLVLEARTRTSADYGTPFGIGFVLSSGPRTTIALGLLNDGAGRKNLFSIGVGYKVKSLD